MKIGTGFAGAYVSVAEQCWSCVPVGGCSVSVPFRVLRGRGADPVSGATSIQLEGNTTYRLTYVHAHIPSDGGYIDRPALFSFRIALTDPYSVLYEENVDIQSTDASGKTSGYYQYRKLSFAVPHGFSTKRVDLRFNYTEMVRTPALFTARLLRGIVKWSKTY
jgi:hypothetical protein